MTLLEYVANEQLGSLLGAAPSGNPTLLAAKAIAQATILISATGGDPNEVVMPSGGSGSSSVYGGTGTPEGVQTATGPAFYIEDDGSANFVNLWIKPDGVTGNTGWQY